jgi:hypothetical protein
MFPEAAEVMAVAEAEAAVTFPEVAEAIAVAVMRPGVVRTAAT